MKRQMLLSLVIVILTVACASGGTSSPATPLPSPLPTTTPLPTALQEPTLAPTETSVLEQTLEATQAQIATEPPAAPTVVLSPLETMQTDAQRIMSLAWTSDSTLFAAGTGGIVKTNLLVGNPMTGDWTLQVLTGASEVSQVAWSPNGATLGIVGGAGSRLFSLFDVATGAPTTTIERSSVTSMTWALDVETLTLGVENGDIVLWKPATDEIVTTLDGGNDWIDSVAWSPDGTKLATAAAGDVIVWGPAEETTYKRLLTIQDAGDDVTWSPDGSMLATGGKHSGIWNAGTGELLLKLDASATPAWSSDSALIAVNAGKDVVVLDAKTGSILFTAQGHTRSIRAIDWSPNGATIISGDDDGVVMVWGVKR